MFAQNSMDLKVWFTGFRCRLALQLNPRRGPHTTDGGRTCASVALISPMPPRMETLETQVSTALPGYTATPQRYSWRQS